MKKIKQIRWIITNLDGTFWSEELHKTRAVAKKDWLKTVELNPHYELFKKRYIQYLITPLTPSKRKGRK